MDEEADASEPDPKLQVWIFGKYRELNRWILPLHLLNWIGPTLLAAILIAILIARVIYMFFE